jgi:hypothetical protein
MFTSATWQRFYNGVKTPARIAADQNSTRLSVTGRVDPLRVLEWKRCQGSLKVSKFGLSLRFALCTALSTREFFLNEIPFPTQRTLLISQDRRHLFVTPWVPYSTLCMLGADTERWILQQLHSKTVLAHIGAFPNKCTIKHHCHTMAT